MDKLLSLETLGSVIGSVLLLIGVFFGLLYKARNYVNKDQIKLYVTHEKLSKISRDYIREETHKKDIEHLAEIFTSRLGTIAEDIHDIKEGLKSRKSNIS